MMIKSGRRHTGFWGRDNCAHAGFKYL